MTKFLDIPQAEFPLNSQKYNELMDQIRTAARGFAKLGTAEGRAVDKELMEVWARLSRAWELIQDIEQREKAARP